MSNLVDNLNKEQAKAVLSTNGPLAIIAGAGSGKTRTLTHKVAYLIQEKNIEPERILAVTFSNKAAKEMKNRIIDIVGNEAKKSQISTYHSLCVKILKDDIDKIGIKRNFNIIDNIDQKMILKGGYKKYGLSIKGIPNKNILEFISNQKFSGAPIETLKKEANSEYENGLVNLYEFYLEETIKANSLDFDDLILLTVKLFKKDENVVKKWAKKFDYVLADEFQDTSLQQYEIIKMISMYHKNITVVGDPDQTIYTWRRANSKLLTNFKDNFPESKTIFLIENYRSTPQILNAANNLIIHNESRIKKELFTTKDSGKKIEYFHAFSEEAEARWIVQEINQLKKDKTQLKNIAILFRANYLSNSLEKALIRESIDYVLFGGVRFYQRAEIKDAISFLKVINDGDEFSLRRIINVPSRKIGPTSLEKIIKFAEEKKLSSYNAITQNFNNLPLTRATLINLADFINLIRKYKIALKNNPISSVLNKFLIEVKYLKSLPLGEEGRIDSIKELIFSIKEWEKRNPKSTLSDFISEISLYIDKDESDRLKDYVSLMTVHNSKGLEFDNVFIFGFSEGVFPSKRAIDEGGKSALEEERRLAYVATTRACKKLSITSSRGYNVDHTMQKKPSRFLKEMGIDYNKFSNNYIAPINLKDNYNNNNFVEGDKVLHEKFGKGIIVHLSGEIAQIAFKNPYGVKSMMKNHKSLKGVIE